MGTSVNGCQLTDFDFGTCLASSEGEKLPTRPGSLGLQWDPRKIKSISLRIFTGTGAGISVERNHNERLKHAMIGQYIVTRRPVRIVALNHLTLGKVLKHEVELESFEVQIILMFDFKGLEPTINNDYRNFKMEIFGLEGETDCIASLKLSRVSRVEEVITKRFFYKFFIPERGLFLSPETLERIVELNPIC
ncbi:hypothetical protein J6590_062153 [Homalodisca vitripennis]|nr:hypothetical protein J6590_062153 [Homalodisca vitripennis]